MSPLSFAHHCLVGSFAGVMEHTLLYPLDTVKTCWQSQVLSWAAGVGGTGTGGGGGGGCGIFPGGGSSMAMMTATMATGGGNHHGLVAHHHNHRGIWSTMKHLIHQGRHHHHHHRIRPPPSSQQQVHALAAGAMAVPNVVDLTNPAMTVAIRGGGLSSSRAAASPPLPGRRAGGGAAASSQAVECGGECNDWRHFRSRDDTIVERGGLCGGGGDDNDVGGRPVSIGEMTAMDATAVSARMRL
ncbi:hypothetical protein ACHAW5_009878 [Stephanodiscus triporus]|uniref:Uncharacterized protein n=1 Tax=Stephanodiscus triporus TaxID=2934178 RepID=A0ABD3NDC0_9STRA